jgi:uncharacterized membrane protein
MARSPLSWPWWRWVLTGLSALGLASSSYLAWHSLLGGTVIGCGVGSPCEEVLGSRWSSIGGVVPVSGLAAGAYLAMLLDSFFLGLSTELPVRRLAWRAMLILTGAAAGSAVWFIILQKWEIGSFCPYCMATHITGLLLTALVIWRAPRQVDDDAVEQDSSAGASVVIRRWPAVGMAFSGVALAGILVVSQIVFAPPAVYRGGESLIDLPTLDPHAEPMIGSPDARYVVTLLFDYECPHCQQLHSMLDEVIHRYKGKVAFALCPTPLNPQCNPYIPRVTAEFQDSCDLTKIALAVWVAKREKFPDFDRWMFAREPGEHWQPRTIEAARAKAVELLGQAGFEGAQNDPHIDQYIQTSVEIYGRSLQVGNAVPKLILGSRWVLPQPNSADDLVKILHDSLGMPKP